MNPARRAGWILVALFFIWLALPACRAQANETAPPSGLPPALWVPDRFERAIHDGSTAHYYVLVTVVNDVTGGRQRVCIEGKWLVKAVEYEYRIYDRWKLDPLILNNKAREYHFTNVKAWELVQPRYSPQMLLRVEDGWRNIPTIEITHARVSEKINVAFDTMQKNYSKEADRQYDEYLEATVCVLQERGLFAGRGDIAGVFFLTPHILAEQERRYKEIRERQHLQKILFLLRYKPLR